MSTELKERISKQVTRLSALLAAAPYLPEQTFDLFPATARDFVEFVKNSEIELELYRAEINELRNSYLMALREVEQLKSETNGVSEAKRSAAV